jgi:hypothetical protein
MTILRKRWSTWRVESVPQTPQKAQTRNGLGLRFHWTTFSRAMPLFCGLHDQILFSCKLFDYRLVCVIKSRPMLHPHSQLEAKVLYRNQKHQLQVEGNK